jgi:two-component system sensor histidine kinase VicK
LKSEKLMDNKIMKIFFETSPDMLAILDKDGRILDCNSHFAKNGGYQKSDVLGKIAPIDLVSEKDRMKSTSAFNEVIEKGVKRDVPINVLKKDGSTYPSLWSGATFFDESGNLEGYIITGKDLSEIHQLKNEIQQSKKQHQKEKMIMLGQLTGRIAHDIKNPLNVINMVFDMLSKNPELKLSDKLVQEKLKIGSKNLSRINNQVNIVLDHIREKPISHDMVLLSNCVSESIKQIIVPENVKINIEKSNLSVHGDLFQLGIACANIINNSIQSFGGKSGEISVGFIEDENYVIIEISDSGPGIPEEDMPMIFEPLFTTKQNGTGLGLVSCKNIVKNHGGQVKVKNDPTTFTIRLPKK